MTLKNWFIANRKNNFHPHALRPAGLTIFFALIFAITPLYNITSAGRFQVLGYATNISVSDLHALSNQQRADNGLGGLSLNTQLNRAASAKANDMINKNYWSHTSPDGTPFQAFITSAGYNYAVAGENLAKNFSTSSGVINAWMGSSSHRANVLGSYTHTGFAVVNGELQGEETTLVVAMYGKPKAAPKPAPAPTPKPAPAATQRAPSTSSTTEPSATEEPKPEEENPSPPEEPEERETTEAKDEKEATIAPVSGTDLSGGNILGSASPVTTYKSLNWGQKTTIFLLSALLLLSVLKHTLVWRQQRRGLRHIWLRSHPLGQTCVIAIAIILTAVSSAGVII